MRALHLADRLGLPRVASVQNPYNLLNRTFEVGLAEIAHRENVGLLAYSPLAYVNSRSFLTSNIIGATTMEQLESNLASESLTLDQAVLEAIEAVHQRIPNPVPYKHASTRTIMPIARGG